MPSSMSSYFSMYPSSNRMFAIASFILDEGTSYGQRGKKAWRRRRSTGLYLVTESSLVKARTENRTIHCFAIASFILDEGTSTVSCFAVFALRILVSISAIGSLMRVFVYMPAVQMYRKYSGDLAQLLFQQIRV